MCLRQLTTYHFGFGPQDNLAKIGCFRQFGIQIILYQHYCALLVHSMKFGKLTLITINSKWYQPMDCTVLYMIRWSISHHMLLVLACAYSYQV